MKSLGLRIPMLAMAILVVSLSVATGIAYELLLVSGRSDLDNILSRERRRFQRSISEIMAEIAEETNRTRPYDVRLLRRAVDEYLSLNPSNQFYMTFVRIEDGVHASPGGPEMMVSLLQSEQLPRPSSGRLQAINTPLGELRSLSAPVFLANQRAATFQVAGPTEPIRRSAFQAVTRIGIAAGFSLLLGGILLFFVLRRALAPLRELVSAARAAELQDLSKRVKEPERRDEVGLLARDFNLMMERLQHAAESDKEFMAAVSHELRTPITIARGYLETLEAGGSAEELDETVSVLRDELHKMGRLVEDLMALARSESEGFLSPAPVDVGRFFDELSLRLTGLGAEDVVLHPPAAMSLTADADRLAQALLNLVVNARVHNPPGTAVEVGAFPDGDESVFYVRDRGPGIDPQVKARMFHPFVKGQRGSSSTGLGLAVVRAIVAAHGGRIQFSSGREGTTIALVFPAEASDAVTATAYLRRTDEIEVEERSLAVP